MKKFLALGYMLALPLVSGAKILPSIVTILLFATTSPSGAVGVFQTFNILGLGITGSLFTYFVTSFFPGANVLPAPPGPGNPISNWIMGL